MTVIIPAAGLGKRLQPHTFTQPKVLLSVAGKPILGYILDSLKTINPEKVIFIIGSHGKKVKDFVQQNYKFQAGFVEQKASLGLGYAVSLAKNYAVGPVLIILGDTLIETDFKKLIREPGSWLAVKEVAEPERFGICEKGPDGYIKNLVEKPKKPLSNLAICGLYYLKNSSLLFQCLTELIKQDIKTKGEYQLTDALRLMIQKGEKIKAITVKNWLDCGKLETLLSTNQYLLKSKIKNQKSKNLPGNIIKKPVFIGKNCRINNCLIGPYVSIGNQVQMENVIIQNAIVNDAAVIKNIILSDSVIGQSSVLVGKMQKINLGDSSSVVLGEQ